MTNVHKIFISFHHENDQHYFEKLQRIGKDIFVDRSVDTGDIDPNLKVDTIRRKIRDDYIRDASVVVVLIGDKTWQRKHVDWEISAGIRKTKNNPRCGLIGIFLPTHPDFNSSNYDKCIIPPRLYYNRECGFASLHDWKTKSSIIQDWIHRAFLRRDQIDPDNSYPMFAKNRYSKSWC